MLKKFISTAAALSLCAALATMVSAELNYTNARPTDTQVVDFNEAEVGTISDASIINVQYLNDGAKRQNQHKYTKTVESGTTPEIKAGIFGKAADTIRCPFPPCIVRALITWWQRAESSPRLRGTAGRFHGSSPCAP